MSTTAETAKGIARAIDKALETAARFEAPYRHWIMRDLAPSTVLDELLAIDFTAPDLDGVSGKRELHNDQRHYFDRANMARFRQWRRWQTPTNHPHALAAWQNFLALTSMIRF